MQHTKKNTLKIAILEVDDFTECEDFFWLLGLSLRSKEGNDWESEERTGYIDLIMNVCELLSHIREIIFQSSEKNPSMRSLDYDKKSEMLELTQLMPPLEKLYNKFPPRKLCWDLWTLFMAAILTKRTVEDDRRLAGVGFSIKLFSQFSLDAELIVSTNIKENLCIEMENFNNIFIN